MPGREVRLETFDAEIHLQKLREWLYRPHVARWWGDPKLALEHSVRCSPESHVLIVVDGVPAGYLCWQTLPQSEREAAGLADLPENLMDIDVLIGEPEFIDCGVGTKSLGLLLARFRLDPYVTIAGVGTSVSNERALRAFEKAGFRLFREFQDPEFGLCWYLVIDVRDDA